MLIQTGHKRNAKLCKKSMKNTIVYIVEALRHGDRENHSYVVGVYTTLEKAKVAADDHISYRGGKYGCAVIQAELNQKMNSDWNATLMYEAKSTAQLMSEDDERGESLL